ncbi:Acb2/Tad1 domain-containing protein [Kaistia sp. MMO-174]|uniref:Acb2/Tad1 domain-containing protein n=1 Tax=Kaistia sp. MMO-174 TaxID=3081256 RepID=UPI00301935E6
MRFVGSTSDDRVVNNTLRHSYRVLSDEEKAAMAAIKDKGAEFLALIESLRTAPEPLLEDDGAPTLDAELRPMAIGTFDRELNIAVERIEEAVMWAVKHVTA